MGVRRLVRAGAGITGPGVGDDTLRRRVAGRVVLVTGASEGVGAAVARRLGAAGAVVLLVARTADRLDAVRDEIRAAGGTAHAHPTDLSRTDDVAALADEVLARYGRVDVVVSNAGRSIRRSVADTADRFHDVRRLEGVNHLGPVQLLLRLLPAMRAAGSGHVVNVSTAALGVPSPHWSSYLASKAAFDAWLRCVAPEVRADGVTVSTVHLGLVRTRMSAPTAHYDRMPAMTADEAADVVCRAVALRRSWRPWWSRVGATASAAAPEATSRAVATSLAAGRSLRPVTGLVRTRSVAPRRLAALAAGIARQGPTFAALAEAAPPSAVALVDRGGPLTHADLDAAARRCAAACRRAGVGPGDRVAVACELPRDTLAALVATGRMRVDAILVPPDLPPDRLARLLDEQRVAATVHGADDVRAHAGPRTPIRASAAHPSAAHRSGVRPPRWGGVVVLTSGTTGAPRGVSHRLPGRTLAAAVGTHLDLVPMRRGEAIVVVPPLHHGYGLCYLAAGLGLGAVVVVPDRADPRGILDAVLDSGATVLVALPIHLRRIVDLPPEVLAGYAARLPGSLRTVVTGSAPLPSCVLDRARDLFGDRVLDLYGSTEAGWASVATPADLRAAPGTVGRPPRGVGVRIVGASGRVLPPGAVGAVQVRGWRARGAWVATGDVGHRDVEGRLFLDGRADEMIVSGGENVYPGPTLAALRAHPGVADALLCPVPDDEFGTRWRAAVRARPGTTLTEDELRGWMRPRLARAEVPRDIEIVTEMPRGATGKPVRAPG